MRMCVDYSSNPAMLPITAHPPLSMRRTFDGQTDARSSKRDESGMGRDESGFLGRIGRGAGTNRAREPASLGHEELALRSAVKG